jgi:twinkle protein
MSDEDNITPFPRHGLAGYYSLADLPQWERISECAISTGYSELDEVCKLYSGQLLIVTGLPSHGKSTLMLNIIKNLAVREGIHSYLYVPENERTIANKFRLLFGDDSAGFQHFMATQCFVQSAQTEHYGGEPHTLPWILEHAAQAIERDSIEFVLIDPWNELEHAKPKDLMMTDYIRDSLRLVKQFTRHFEIVFCLVVHPTKAAADREVTLADCEGSMSWWNKADTGLVVVRDVNMKVICAKVREEPDAGRPGVRNFWVDRDTGIITPLVGEASGYDQKAARQRQRNR